MEKVRKRLLTFPEKRLPLTSTDLQCYLCGKPIMKNLRIRLMIHVIDGGGTVLHPDSEDNYDTDNGDMYFQDIGTFCARKLGKQWVVALKEPL